MSNAFAGAVDALFADPNLAEDAVYTPVGGAPQGDPVRVIRVPTDQIIGFGDTQIAGDGVLFDVRVSEVPAALKGDRFDFGGVVRELKEDAVHPPNDVRGLIWRIDSAPVG